MFGWLNRLLTAAFVAGSLAAGVVLLAPPGALACNGGPSAQNVYKECLPSGGGGTPTGGGTQAGGHGANAGSTSVSNQTAQAIKHAGKDRRALAALVHRYGPSDLLQSNQEDGTATAPTALGSAFDLGSGPTALLIVLAGTALLLLGGSGMRFWRGRQRP